MSATPRPTAARSSPSRKPSCKPPRETAARRVAESIRDLIRRERIPPGGRLPTEHELARRFRASRPIVREAITTLRALGLVETRPRVGLRRLDFDPADVFDRLVPWMGAPEWGADLRELRRLIEPSLLVLVLRRATADDYRRLEAQLASGLAGDSAFHEALWQLAGNRFLCGLRGLLLSAVGPVLPSRRMMQEHRAILRALQAGDLNEATRLMRAHLGP